VRSAAVDVIVIDSVAALVPRAEIEGEMGDSHVGLQARLMSQALRKLAGVVSKTNTCIIFINQIRMKIGVMFGNPETTTGGNALKFYSSVRLDIRRIANLKEGEEIIGNRTKVKVVKNKVAPPFRTAEFDIVYGEGISFYGDLVDLGVQAGVVDKSGAWLLYGEDKLGQGRERAKQYLRDNPALAKTIEEKVRAHFNVPTLSADGTIVLPGSAPEAVPAEAAAAKSEAARPAARPDDKAATPVAAAKDGKPAAKPEAKPAPAKPPVKGAPARSESRR
jgi:recombination protein RecA